MRTAYQRPLVRLCVECGAPLSPERHGHYCTEHGCESPPPVIATARWSAREHVWLLTVTHCPFCGRPHHHGGGGDSVPDMGFRASHCVTGPGGTYDLIAETSSDGCLGPQCAVRIGHQVHRCSGCERGAA